MTTRDDLLTRLAIASGSATVAPPWQPSGDGTTLRPPTPDEWAAHLMAHADALGRAADARLASDASTAEHEHECAPDSCAAGCPDALRRRAEPGKGACGLLADDIEAGHL